MFKCIPSLLQAHPDRDELIRVVIKTAVWWQWGNRGAPGSTVGYVGGSAAFLMAAGGWEYLPQVAS